MRLREGEDLIAAWLHARCRYGLSYLILRAHMISSESLFRVSLQHMLSNDPLSWKGDSQANWQCSNDLAALTYPQGAIRPPARAARRGEGSARSPAGGR